MHQLQADKLKRNPDDGRYSTYYGMKTPRPSPARTTRLSASVIPMMANHNTYYEMKTPRPSPVRATH